MILAATDLWMPMGVVICFGAILTMPMVVTLLPVAYWKLFENRLAVMRNNRFLFLCWLVPGRCAASGSRRC